MCTSLHILTRSCTYQDFPADPDDKSSVYSDFVRDHVVRNEVRYFQKVKITNEVLKASQSVQCYPFKSGRKFDQFHGTNVQVRAHICVSLHMFACF